MTRRFVVWVGAIALILGGFSYVGVGCMNKDGGASRTVTADEAARLSGVRQKNLAMGTVAVLARMPKELGETEISGWVDWTQPLVYAAVKPSSQPTYTGLVQAVPGLVATRPGDHAADPATLPADGWSVRRTSVMESEQSPDPTTRALDIVLSAMMVLAADRPDDQRALQEKALWLEEGTIDGVPVDVFRAPLAVGPAPDPSSSASAAPAGAQPEAIMHVDREGRLRRLQVNPGGQGLATIDLLLEQRPDPAQARIPAIDLLGGPPVAPRKVTDAEATLLAGLRKENAGTVSTVDLTMPVADGEVLRAVGWVDWRRPLLYLTVDNPGEEQDGQMLVLPGGVGWRSAPVKGEAKRPPATPPAGGWRTQAWSERVDPNAGAGDMDLLLFKLMSLVSGRADDTAVVKEHASWLREARLGKLRATTFELPMSGDQAAPSGQAPFRYWVTNDKSLRRVEMRTRQYGLAHADLAPGTLGYLQIPSAVTAALGG
ncbi:hypothetical protein Afil01_37700 [Actinorhabdospora filicis]|uniref:Uncharacterized protein n=1 Tax=Actinorhabdospora filicis TaxID=1785913 RepID=A0A9W6SMI7_9ACTN|nr:hypothetical protein [Actinorhabdospora filicis]GLZ78963.1 hypothetical protein Afil01_37700 [Actinorhabdospora filicis]